MSWASGVPQDSEQQRSLQPLLAAGKQAGLSFVGWVEGAANKGEAVASAQSAGLSAIALADVEEHRNEPLLISWTLRSRVRWDSPAPILVVRGTEWPKIRGSTVEEDDTALAGPTGMPWVNSNGWFVQLAKVRSNDKTIWLDFDDKERAAVHKTGAYLLALADTGVCGGHWIISLDDNFRSALPNQNPEALDRWRRISATLDFFKQHSDWRSFRSKSILAVLSDFSGDNHMDKRRGTKPFEPPASSIPDHRESQRGDCLSC